MDRMKICIATHHFPPKFFAGAEQYALRLARNLHRRGHEVQVVTVDAIDQGQLEPQSKIELYEGIPVHYLTYNLSLAQRAFPLLYRNPYLGEWFRRFFETDRPDLLHVNSGYLLGGAVIEQAHALGIPIALTLHEFWFLCPINTLLRTNGRICDEPVPPARCKWCLMSQKRRYRLLDQWSNGWIGDAFVEAASSPLLAAWAERDADIQEINERREYLQKVYAMLDLVISPSQFLIDKMSAYHFHHANIVRLSYGLQNIPETVQKKNRIPGRLRAGFLGRISPEKGIDVLIKAMQRISTDHISLDIYGQVDETDAYVRYLRRLASRDARIRFRGRYDQSELPEILNHLDVTVVPSIWYENRPGTILEAFAYHTPVVASRLGGMVEMIQHDINGLLFSVNDADDLSRQLMRLLSEPNLLPRLEAGILPVHKVDDEIEQVLHYYQALSGFAQLSAS
jgi:glycosyltransferase involved in cell wall biosynthesis